MQTPLRNTTGQAEIQTGNFHCITMTPRPESIGVISVFKFPSCNYNFLNIVNQYPSGEMINYSNSHMA